MSSTAADVNTARASVFAAGKGPGGTPASGERHEGDQSGKAEPHLQHPLTARQQRILAAVESFGRRHGYPPTLREIGEAVGLTRSSARTNSHACVTRDT